MSKHAIARGVALAVMLMATGETLRAQERGGERMSKPGKAADYNEDGQAKRLPPLPSGMTLAMIREGDSLFRTTGGCQTCHGQDAEGMPAMGSSLTSGLNFIPSDWGLIDSLITSGIPEPVTRTPIAMPARGAQTNLDAEQIRRIGAYVWAISRVQDEPWEGGHRTHAARQAQSEGS
jgi:mono/diheme cytochrome c family protein